MFLVGEIPNIMKLIELVKKRPALYDFCITEHGNKAHVDKLWQEVATEMGEGVMANDIKRRWNSLRNGMSRNLRNQEEKRKAKKWYLADHLEFLREFLPARTKAIEKEKPSNLQKDSTLPENKTFFQTQDQEVIIECVSSDEETNNSNSKRSFASLSSSSMNESKRFAATEPLALLVPLARPVLSAPPVQLAQPAFQELPPTVPPAQSYPHKIEHHIVKQYPLSKRKSAEEIKMVDERNMTFFKSIIPDLLRLSERRQRLYKQNVIKKLNRFLDEEEILN